MPPWSPFWSSRSGRRAQDAMILGRTLMASATPYYSEWLPSAGTAAAFVIEVMAIGASTTFTVEVETKSVDQTDAQASSVEELAPASTTGVLTATGTGIKELVRLKYTVGGAGTLRYVHFRWLEVSWSV